MKIQTGNMLVQDMGLKVGEIFQIGEGPDAFRMRYDGHDGHDGPNGRRCDCNTISHGKWGRLLPVTN